MTSILIKWMAPHVLDAVCLAYVGLPLASQLNIAKQVFDLGVTSYRWIYPLQTKVNSHSVSTTFVSIRDIEDDDGEPMVLLTAHN